MAHSVFFVDDRSAAALVGYLTALLPTALLKRIVAYTRNSGTSEISNCGGNNHKITNKILYTVVVLLLYCTMASAITQNVWNSR